MSNSNGKLFVVATPIGNMGDCSPRARKAIAEADIVLCEDTRVTAKLLAGLELAKPLRTFHEHTDERRMHELVSDMLTGQTMALVTDAGTPGVNDPGGALIAAAAKAGVSIVPIPGPNAATTALSVSGAPADRYTFLGFPPHKKGRETFFRDVESIEQTVVMYESTHRIVKTLEALKACDRRLVVCRELTKLHETIYRGSPDDILAALAATSTKGEFVIVIAPKGWK